MTLLRAKYSKRRESEFASALMTINNTMRTMGESLQRVHELLDKLLSAESAKKAKLVQDQSELATNATSVVRELSRI